MSNKITLYLDKDLIKRAKTKAFNEEKSVSEICRVLLNAWQAGLIDMESFEKWYRAWELSNLLQTYADNGMILMRCSNCSPVPFWVKLSEPFICHKCSQPLDRLLADGTWQSKAERDRENQLQYQKVSSE